jgi:hypothetical protein
LIEEEEEEAVERLKRCSNIYFVTFANTTKIK